MLDSVALHQANLRMTVYCAGFTVLELFNVGSSGLLPNPRAQTPTGNSRDPMPCHWLGTPPLAKPLHQDHPAGTSPLILVLYGVPGMVTCVLALELLGRTQSELVFRVVWLVSGHLDSSHHPLLLRHAASGPVLALAGHDFHHSTFLDMCRC